MNSQRLIISMKWESMSPRDVDGVGKVQVRAAVEVVKDDYPKIPSIPGYEIIMRNNPKYDDDSIFEGLSELDLHTLKVGNTIDTSTPVTTVFPIVRDLGGIIPYIPVARVNENLRKLEGMIKITGDAAMRSRMEKGANANKLLSNTMAFKHGDCFMNKVNVTLIRKGGWTKRAVCTCDGGFYGYPKDCLQSGIEDVEEFLESEYGFTKDQIEAAGWE